MVFKIELPQVGESVTEAIIGKWLKSPGEHIDKYDPLVEVITDKVNMDVPAPATGTLTKILASEGDTVPMGSVIAEMETDEAVTQADSRSPSVPATPSGAKSETSPLAARIGTLVQGANVGPTGGEFLDPAFLESGAATIGVDLAPTAPVVGSMRLTVGGFTKTEGVAPYALFGDSGGDFAGGLVLAEGDHTLRLEVFDDGGAAMADFFLDFIVGVEPVQVIDPMVQAALDDLSMRLEVVEDKLTSPVIVWGA